MISIFLEFILFADDINLLIVTGDNLRSLFNNINYEMDILFNWLSANMLSINLKNANYILFHHPNKNIDCDYHLYINIILINRVTFCRFLGILLDENITWEVHINLIQSKVSKNCGILSISPASLI